MIHGVASRGLGMANIMHDTDGKISICQVPYKASKDQQASKDHQSQLEREVNAAQSYTVNNAALYCCSSSSWPDVQFQEKPSW